MGFRAWDAGWGVLGSSESGVGGTKDPQKLSWHSVSRALGF